MQKGKFLNINKKNKKCIKCKSYFAYSQEDTWWDEKGMSSTKLVKCPLCNCVQAIKYSELQDLNNDERYYK